MTSIIRRVFFSGILAAVGLLALALGSDGASAMPVSCLGSDCTVSDGAASIAYRTSVDPELKTFSINGTDNLSEEEYHLCFDCNTSSKLGVELDNNLTLTSATQDEAANMVTAIFEGSGLKITFDHLLTGGANSGTIDETITIENTQSTALQFVLTELDDFDLNDTSDGDSASFNGDFFTQTDGPVSLFLSSSSFDFFTVGDCCEFNLLTDTLVGGHLGGVTSFGPGDAAFALEYDISLAAGQSAIIRKQKVLFDNDSAPAGFKPKDFSVPEPGVLSLFGFGLIGLGAVRRRRRRGAPQAA